MQGKILAQLQYYRNRYFNAIVAILYKNQYYTATEQENDDTNASQDVLQQISKEEIQQLADEQEKMLILVAYQHD